MPPKKPQIQKMDGQSLNLQAKLVECLKNNAPEVFTEGKIDLKKLKATLGQEVEAGEERYGLNWLGKMECFKRIQETTTDTLKPNRKESVNFDKTENLFIEGDNLQVLKILQHGYYGKIKMIYIDPPYNTGNDFIYNDSFAQEKKEYLKEVGAIDENGYVLNDSLYRQNTKDSGHFHSNWLNMMYPRLYVAHKLLRKDGVIFVSIDDNEVKNLRAIMDEIFGEENFVAQIIWKRKRGKDNSAKFFSRTHEYLLCYTKSFGDDFEVIKLSLSEETKRAYRNPDKDPRGPYRLLGVWARGTQGGSRFEFTAKTGKFFNERLWLVNKETMTKLSEDNRLVIVKDNVYRKLFLTENEGAIPETIWDDASNAANAADEIKVLFNGLQVFDTVKPVPYLMKMLQVATSEDDIILDFFAGSGTTAHAVMQLNAEDGGKRKWICVQLPEKCKEDSEAAKAGFATIADIAKERIRRASKVVYLESVANKSTVKQVMEWSEKGWPKEVLQGYTNFIKQHDNGFKVFKLDESNFKIWNTQVENAEQLEQQMLDFIDNVKADSTKENLLYELIVKSGLEMNVAIEEKKVGKGVYYRIGDGSLVICLDEVTEKLFDAILADKPKKIIVLDGAFKGNDQLITNSLLRAGDEGVEEVRIV